MGIPVDVMACRDADARTQYPKGLILVWANGAPVRGPFEPSPECPAVMILTKRFSFGEGQQAVLAQENRDSLVPYLPVRGDGAGPMFNGRFIWTSDARFGEATAQGPFAQPVKLMDRWETATEASS